MILEANDRIGGRAYVGKIPVGEIGDPDAPIDYGGAWIHGIAANPLTRLPDELSRKAQEARTPRGTRSVRRGRHAADR